MSGYKSKDNLKKSIFTAKELNIIHKIKSYFQNFNVKKIVEFSYQEKAFLETELFKFIAYR